jgi:hypothetical protein
MASVRIRPALKRKAAAMTENQITVRRSRTVLRLLAKHGPLSVRSLEACMSPAIKRKKLNLVLSRMQQRGLVTTRYAKLFGGTGTYYQLAQDPASQFRIAAALQIDPDAIVAQGVRNFDLLHSEQCAMWTEYLALLFPEAKVVRETGFRADEELSSVLLASAEDREFVPDLVVTFPANDDGEKVHVAVEIEKSAKARIRLLKKLSKYADETKFDGVIYICDSGAISRRLSDVYNASVFRRSLRIQHFGANFFLFSDGTTNVGADDPLLINAAFERVRLRDWISTLRRDSLFDRRDLKFHKGGVVSPHTRQPEEQSGKATRLKQSTS